MLKYQMHLSQSEIEIVVPLSIVHLPRPEKCTGNKKIKNVKKHNENVFVPQEYKKKNKNTFFTNVKKI